MKKIGLMFVLFLGLANSALFAQGYNPYSRQELARKVKNMEVLDDRKIPFPFVYTEKVVWYDNQPDINIFYNAKNVCEKNPFNFAAVYNYALLIMSNDWGEGPVLNEIQIDEAYRLFEQAKKMRPEYINIYFAQIYLLEQKMLGVVYGPDYSDEEKVYLYGKDLYSARRMLSLYEKMFTMDLGKQNMQLSYMMHNASLLCRALGQTQKAQEYEAKAQTLYEQEEAPRAAQIQKAENERILKQALQKAFKREYK